MNGIKFGPRGFKIAGFTVLQTSNDLDGICKFCKEWSAELDKSGFCKEELCRKQRQEINIKIGRAVKYYDGLGGNKIVVDKRYVKRKWIILNTYTEISLMDIYL